MDLGSQFAAGRNTLPGDEVSAKDRLSVSIVDLAMQGLGLVAINQNDCADRGSEETH